jgi:RNAse (barnase) inhibitor barstar
LIINIENIKLKSELHLTLKENLGLPEFYGMNWDALWDSITGLIEMPNLVIIKGFNNFAYVQPAEAAILKSIVNQYNAIGEKKIILE